MEARDCEVSDERSWGKQRHIGTWEKAAGPYNESYVHICEQLRYIWISSYWSQEGGVGVRGGQGGRGGRVI